MTSGSQHRVALLDVNVLVALAWPNHVGHGAARSWFASHSAGGWATSPMTEAGFVRVSSNRRAIPTATTPALALDMLEQLTSQPGHVFWIDDVPLVTGGYFPTTSLRRHEHVTDGHLVALCLTNAGQLVTFDRGIAALAPSRSTVELLSIVGSP